MINSEARYRSVVHYKYFLRSLRKVCKIYNVSKSSLHRWVHADQVGVNKRQKRKKKELSVLIRSVISKNIADNPFITCKELVNVICTSCNVGVSISTASRYVKQCGFSRKKAFPTVVYKHSKENIEMFCEKYKETSNIVCIDEAGFYAGDHKKYGYSKIGSRLNTMTLSNLRRVKFTLLLAISSKGIVDYHLMEHNCKKGDFINFFKKLDIPKQTTIVMDNIRFHHSTEIKDISKNNGWTLLYTPPYCPRANAIEQIFGSLKSDYRASCPSTPDHTFDYFMQICCVLEMWRYKDLSKYINHTGGWIGNVRDKLAADPNYIETFSGYNS
jgi:transposase